MSEKPTQCDRVLAVSKRDGGVCQADFLLPNVCDGGPPITRVAGRIQDLEERGHTFEHIGWRQSTIVYRHLSAPSASEEVPLSEPLEDTPPSLFEVEPPVEASPANAYMQDVRGDV